MKNLTWIIPRKLPPIEDNECQMIPSTIVTCRLSFLVVYTHIKIRSTVCAATTIIISSDASWSWSLPISLLLCYALYLFHFVPSVMSCHSSARKEDSESNAIMEAALWWQVRKGTVQKCFAKAKFKRTETIVPWTATYEDNSWKINDAWWQFSEHNVVARECFVDDFF